MPQWIESDGLEIRPDTWKGHIICGLIPEIPCPDDCSLCCEIGLVFNIYYDAPPYEMFADYYGDGRHNTCTAHNDGKCNVFRNRKLVCRLFGKTEGALPCFLGLQPEYVLSREELRRILWCAGNGTLQDALALKAQMRRG